MGEFPDNLMRLQPGGVGNRVSTLCSQVSMYLAESHQFFQDRVRRDKGEGKGKAKGGQEGWQRQSQGIGQIECPAQTGSITAPVLGWPVATAFL